MQNAVAQIRYQCYLPTHIHIHFDVLLCVVKFSLQITIEAQTLNTVN